MSNNLNDQYFKTRKEHKKSVSPFAWGFFALLVISFIVVAVYVVKEETHLKKSSIKELIKETEIEVFNSLTQAPETTKKTIVGFDELGFEIELHKNLKYSKYPNQNLVLAHALDSTILSYLIAEVPAILKEGNVDENWKNHLITTNHTYEFKDSLHFTYLTVEDNGEFYKGFYKIDTLGEKYFVIQASIIKKEYENNLDKMINLTTTFRRIK